MSDTVIENVAEHRFELPLEGEDIAAAYYQIDENGNLVLTHTEVPSEYGGRGIGTKLATGTFDLIRASGRKAVLRCSFMQRFYATHRNHDDIVVG
ncbi:GNAT family N-acetyltransferase [Paracoccus xiamenensis]|uniref:GNAT family N-acetyltransferase n=1 Tax=Paracoccus xiamenensis TaxID=2714901 RepID=UPI00140DD88F|nr:GNAT family N-acetyltransferase [Paracoccus xiamenensis]NHF73489.1 N-acetyltransferase [Paracoccus xiamenensis]